MDEDLGLDVAVVCILEIAERTIRDFVVNVGPLGGDAHEISAVCTDGCGGFLDDNGETERFSRGIVLDLIEVGTPGYQVVVYLLVLAASLFF